MHTQTIHIYCLVKTHSHNITVDGVNRQKQWYGHTDRWNAHNSASPSPWILHLNPLAVIPPVHTDTQFKHNRDQVVWAVQPLSVSTQTKQYGRDAQVKLLFDSVPVLSIQQGRSAVVKVFHAPPWDQFSPGVLDLIAGPATSIVTTYPEMPPLSSGHVVAIRSISLDFLPASIQTDDKGTCIHYNPCLFTHSAWDG